LLQIPQRVRGIVRLTTLDASLSVHDYQQPIATDFDFSLDSGFFNVAALADHAFHECFLTLLAWQRIVSFAAKNSIRVMDRRPYVIECYAVFALYLVIAHPANQTTENNGNGHPRPSDYGPPMTNSWVNLNPVVQVSHLSRL
jgi:hypothetical protein